jgi:hypothetical protein
MSHRPFRLVLALAACFVPSAVSAAPQGAEGSFHRAYYLEKERGEVEEALALYRSVAENGSADAALREQARQRAAGLAEDLASRDLARLMPPDALLYAELFQPGQAALEVLGQLGLTGSFRDAAASGSFAIRPEMVRELLGVRGLAIAITRLPEGNGPPGGVLVLHAGEIETLRGLLEAGVLAQGHPAGEIEGVPAWTLEGAYVAISARLVVAATDRDAIAGVLRRLGGRDEASLATSPALAAHLARRDGDPFFACVNAVPLRPMLAAVLQQQARGNPGAALAAAALDVQSLQAFVARVRVGEDGLAVETDLYLDEGHRNLAFNLLRGAPLDPVLLERIPRGVAAFVAGSFNPRGPAIAPLERNATGAPVVTAMDFGRELFANLAGWALYVLPGGGALPNAALVVSSNDPARTQAILGFLLGFGNAFATGGALEGQEDEIAGAPTVVYRVPPGIPLYLATHASTLILSPSEDLVEQAIVGNGRGSSVLNDEAFAVPLGRLGKDTTLALCAHAGRLLETAQPYMGGAEREQLARFAPALERTVLALQQRHSSTQLGMSVALHGLPRIGGLVSEMLEQQRASTGSVREEGLQERFERLASHPGGDAEARAIARAELPQLSDDPRALNNFAWALLTETRYAQRFDDLALEAAALANRASGHAVWQYVDTLALARFRTGDVAKAIELGEKALALVDAAGGNRTEVAAALASYRAASVTSAQVGN